MTDNANNGNHKSRLILAPHPFPIRPERFVLGGGENLYYLSWPGWELFLTRRLNFVSSTDDPQPLLLPDIIDPERDFRAIEQLADSASQLGAGFIHLVSGHNDNVFGLMSGIRNYSSASPESTAKPILDDRFYLALWAISEWRRMESDRALAEASAKQRAMLADLKGEDGIYSEGFPVDYSSEYALSGDSPPESDNRGDYAWKCWRRLAENLLKAEDEILPTVAPSRDD